MKNISKPKPKSVLSLDIGKKRIGIAACDPLGITVSRLPALFRNNFDQDLKKLKCLCNRRDVQGLVIGLPLDEKGKSTNQSEFCKEYGTRLALSLKLPIAWVNEHSSTWQAKQNLSVKNDRSGKLDSEAAALLLEQWLLEGPEFRIDR